MRNKFLGTGHPGFNPVRKLRVALTGMRYAILHNAAVAYKVVLSAIILALCFYHRQWLDFGLVLVSTGLMLMAEMFNTTIEALCDFVEEKENPKIGIIKDIAAAATGVSILIWLVVLLLEVLQVL